MLRKEKIGVVAVDSGQLMICDPCYLDEYKDNEYSDSPIKEDEED